MSFTRWLWNRTSVLEKVLVTFVVWIVIAVVNMIIFGKIGLLIFMLGILGSMLFAGLYSISATIKNLYYKYRKEYEAEQEEIVNRLRGSK